MLGLRRSRVCFLNVKHGGSTLRLRLCPRPNLLNKILPLVLTRAAARAGAAVAVVGLRRLPRRPPTRAFPPVEDPRRHGQRRHGHEDGHRYPACKAEHRARVKGHCGRSSDMEASSLPVVYSNGTNRTTGHYWT